MPAIQTNCAIVYTDGSCHTQLRTGAWTAILLTAAGNETLYGIEQNTTHNRMEIIAVIKALEHICNNYAQIIHVTIYTDSQYVATFPSRAQKLKQRRFITASGNELPNTDLIKRFLELMQLYSIALIKVKAHSRSNDEINYNKQADMLCRQLVRDAVKKT